MAGQLSFICFWRACPRQTLLVWQPPHTSITSKCFWTWFSPVSALSLVTPQYGQKATCLHFPLTVRDALLRHTLRGKLISMNSLLMPRGKFGGTTAVRWGGLADPKADKAAGKCSSSFSGVYKGTQPSVAWNSSGGQSASRSFSSRYGIQ